MSDYTIDKGVKIAPTGTGGRRKYPWAVMEVGDSFFVPIEDPDKDRFLRSSIYNAGRSSLTTRGFDRAEYNVVVRKTSENGTVGLRSWLVKKGEGPTPTLSSTYTEFVE